MVADFPKEIEKHTDEFGRWLVEKTLHHWRTTADIFEQRARVRQSAIAAETGNQVSISLPVYIYLSLESMEMIFESMEMISKTY